MWSSIGELNTPKHRACLPPANQCTGHVNLYINESSNNYRVNRWLNTGTIRTRVGGR